MLELNNIHKSVGDINKFLDESIPVNLHGSDLCSARTNICHDIYFTFAPALKKLQKANKQIRFQYGLTEQTDSLQDNRKDSEK